jgi:hypothetical protein
MFSEGVNIVETEEASNEDSECEESEEEVESEGGELVKVPQELPAKVEVKEPNELDHPTSRLGLDRTNALRSRATS